MAGKRKKTVPERFWPKVAKIEDATSCWNWTASLTDLGYGQFAINPGASNANTRAHRVAWELTNGPVPEGLSVLHHCDNRKCCRPDHLYVGTQAQNVDDMMSRDRWGGAVGEDSPHAKLTAEDVIEIRRLHATGQWTMAALGRKFGVVYQLISKIVHRKIWKSLL